MSDMVLRRLSATPLRTPPRIAHRLRAVPLLLGAAAVVLLSAQWLGGARLLAVPAIHLPIPSSSPLMPSRADMAALPFSAR